MLHGRVTASVPSADRRWVPCPGLPEAVAVDFAPDPTTPESLYLLAGPGLQRSLDGGATWTALPQSRPMFMSRLVLDPRTAGTLYVLPGSDEDSLASLYKSVDGGATFQPSGLPPGLRIEDLAIDPRDSRHLLAAGSARRLCAAFQSADGGASWTSFADNLAELADGGSFTAVRFDPVDPRNVYLVGCKRNFKSADGGITWAPFFPDGALAGLEIDPLQPDVLYAAAPRLQKSTDGGRTWRAVDSLPGAVQRLAVDPHVPGGVYAVTADQGVWASTDGGAHWASIGEGLPGMPVQTLAVDPFQPGHLFVATLGHRGLYTLALEPPAGKNLAALLESVATAGRGRGEPRRQRGGGRRAPTSPRRVAWIISGL